MLNDFELTTVNREDLTPCKIVYYPSKTDKKVDYV